MSKSTDFLPIEDYFIIGDLRTAALISKQGSIDWLCLPDFGSPSIFGRLLDPSGGYLAIDMPGYEVDANYVEHTAIVEFQLSGKCSKISVKDFMVPQATKRAVNQQLVRTISGIRGKATIRFKFQPKYNYGSTAPSVRIRRGQLKFLIGNNSVVLHLPLGAVANKKSNYHQISTTVKKGETKQLVLEYISKAGKSSASKAGLEGRTSKFWRQWVNKGQYVSFCRSRLIRSAITLKLMQFYPTGAIVAAPTTSLPEKIGGIRNWDYRYVWIRDATFALYALYVLGHNEEAERFFTFIEKVTKHCAEDNFDVSLMYTIWGDKVPNERHLTNLSGYKNSKPVRIGNQAAQQFQLDVYGSLIDAFYFASKHGLAKASKNRWRKLVMQLVLKIDKLWQKPDHGIWEARVAPKHYTYSKVMAWVGADRANRLKQTLELTDEDLKICTKLAESIRDWVWQNCYRKERQVLTQHPKTQSIDATNLLFILLQFLDKHEPLSRKIIDQTAKELSHKEVFVYRYLKSDGLPGEEGAFWLCSFWLISSLAILEDVKAALKLFNKLEKYIATHGLMSEEFDPKINVYLGNYPQAFSHMGYIMTAHYIDKYARRQNVNLSS